MSATISTLVTRIQRRLEDPEGLHWTSVEIVSAINEARQDFYDYVYQRNRDVFNTQVTEYDWPSKLMSADLGTILSLSNGQYDILLVTVTPTTATASDSNLPVPVRRVPFEELYRHGTDRSLFYGDYFDEGGASIAWTGARNVRDVSLRWAMQGSAIYLDPVPQAEVQLRIQFVRRFADHDEDTTVSGTSSVFSGADSHFERWERIIEYMATLILKGRSDESEDPLIMQLQEKRTLLKSWLDNRSVTGTPRIVLDGY